uniref:Uncharacterized protein n=1 Tax=Cannabis sativa TaxID=3483 RepID=A0A803Q6L8_CANSA
MFETVLGSLAQYSTSYTVWKTLEQCFLTKSKARILKIESQHSIILKGDLSISYYYDKVKILVDSLPTVGQPMNESDLIMHLLNGLGLEYDPVVVHLTSLFDSLSYKSIQSLLLTHESHLERHYTINDTSSKLTANLSTSTPRLGPSSYSSSRFSAYNGRGYSQGQINRSLGRYSGRGAAPSRPLCKVYFKSGHTPVVCHYKFDKSFITPEIGESHAY